MRTFDDTPDRLPTQWIPGDDSRSPKVDERCRFKVGGLSKNRHTDCSIAVVFMKRLVRQSRLPTTRTGTGGSPEGMKSNRSEFSRDYRAALLAHIKEGRKASLEPASGLGSLASTLGVSALDLLKLHEKILIADVLPDCPVAKRAAVLKKAEAFCAVAFVPIWKGNPTRGQAGVDRQLKTLTDTLSHRTVELASAKHELSLEIAKRKAMEKALRAKDRSHSKSLEKSDHLQQQLRHLSRQLLSAQEDERKRISRELHDVVGQTLAGINIRLTTLKKEAAISTQGIGRNIVRTQRLVEKSADIVHRFARELRPAALDDLGLTPALHSFMKKFTAQTGVRTRLTVFKRLDQLNTERRTVLFRVAQEALANVARHAHATHVDVTIRDLPSGISMTIEDNGNSFQVEEVLSERRTKHLGILGMRERVEMVGGRFHMESVPGSGTTVTANIPWRKAKQKALPGSAGN